jgi:hypothetical protein
LLRGAGHRARIGATRWLAITKKSRRDHGNPVVVREKNSGVAEILFIIFIDAIFTTLFEPLFTKVFDVIRQTPAMACVYPARTTD